MGLNQEGDRSAAGTVLEKSGSWSVTASRECLELTERDKEILSALEIYGVLSLDQVWAAFFSRDDSVLETLFLNRPVDYRSGSGHPAYVRMAKLLRYEYVRRTRVPDFGQVFTLTPRGHYWLKSKGSAIFFGLPPAWPREGKLRHSLLVASTGLWFSRWLKLEAVAERELIAGLRSPEKAKAKGFFLRTPLPDLLIKLNGRWTRVEVELSEKSKQRYLRMWEKLKPPSGQPHHWIIYICGDLKLKERLLDCAREVFVPGIHAISISHITNFNDIYGVGIGTQVGR